MFSGKGKKRESKILSFFMALLTGRVRQNLHKYPSIKFVFNPCKRCILKLCFFRLPFQSFLKEIRTEKAPKINENLAWKVRGGAYLAARNEYFIRRAAGFSAQNSRKKLRSGKNKPTSLFSESFPFEFSCQNYAIF